MAYSVLSKRSPEKGGLETLVGDTGADFTAGCKSISDALEGHWRETDLLGRKANMGRGNELGGGEFEYAVPAQLSERSNFLSSASKFNLIGIGPVMFFVFRSEYFLFLSTDVNEALGE